MMYSYDAVAACSMFDVVACIIVATLLSVDNKLAETTQISAMATQPKWSLIGIIRSGHIYSIQKFCAGLPYRCRVVIRYKGNRSYEASMLVLLHLFLYVFDGWGRRKTTEGHRDGGNGWKGNTSF
jgi:hypothetical protein